MRTQRLWSKKVFQVLKFYTEHNDRFLFAVTGDIDNLGLFISQNGRAAGQNLIDIYLRLMGRFLHSYVQEHEDIESFCFLPAGEEVTVMGVARTEEACREFFAVVQSELGRFIIENDHIIHDQKVTIAFGCRIIEDLTILQKIKKFVHAIGVETAEDNKLYFDLMTEIRVLLAHQIDLAKFADLKRALILVGPVFLRNIVYFSMQNYKTSTRELLLRLNQGEHGILNGYGLQENYGVSRGQRLLIEGLVGKLNLPS